jgi:(2Fe-2S) ferredoxin
VTSDKDFVKAKIAKHKIGSYERHIFLCIGPSCCEADEGQKVWDHLKAELSEKDPDKKIFRTKAGCLRICKSGPVALVYPEGTWYGNVGKKQIDQIIESHLIGGEPVEDLMIAANPLINDSGS